MRVLSLSISSFAMGALALVVALLRPTTRLEVAGEAPAKAPHAPAPAGVEAKKAPREVAPYPVELLAGCSTAEEGAEASAPVAQHAPSSAPTSAPVSLGQSFIIPKELAEGMSHVPAVVHTPDGKRLLTATNTGHLIEWEISTQRMLRRIPLSGEGITAVGIDRRGCVVAWVTEKNSLHTMRLDTEARAKEVAGISSKVLSLSPDGRQVAVANGSKVELRAASDLSLLRSWTEHQGEVMSLAFSPSGAELAAVGRDGRLRLWAVEGGELLYQRDHGSPLYAVAFSPEGSRVAFGGEDRVLYQLDLRRGELDRLAEGQPFWITAIAYSPDGELIAFGDESCDVWINRVSEKKNLFHSKHHVECWLNSVSWSPDGRSLLFGCRPNTYAGRPSIYDSNSVEEAAQAPEVQQYEREIAALEGLLGVALQREELSPLRERLEAIQKRTPKGQSYATYQGSSGAQLFNNDVNGAQVPLNLDNNQSPQLVTWNGADNNIAQIDNNAVQVDNAPLQNSINFIPAPKQSLALSKEVKELYDEMAAYPELKEIVTPLRELREKQLSAMQSRYQFLNDNWCVNQWNIAF